LKNRFKFAVLTCLAELKERAANLDIIICCFDLIFIDSKLKDEMFVKEFVYQPKKMVAIKFQEHSNKVLEKAP
jgi:hypothetical protein